MSSFGDWIALSDIVDVSTANVIFREVNEFTLGNLYSYQSANEFIHCKYRCQMV